MQLMTDAQCQAVVEEVEARFAALIAAINARDAAAWAAFYSDTASVSAVAGIDVYATKQDWVTAVEAYFAARASQAVTPVRVRVTPLGPDLALLVSQELSDMTLADGPRFQGRHVFTMLWNRESDGWRIVHSHESWLDDAAQS